MLGGTTQEGSTAMLLVPRQLQRVGMTGDVPYYGGRLTPAQAYAASHPRARPAPVPPAGQRAPVPTAADSGRGAPPEARRTAGSVAALDELRDAGVITPEEYAGLRARVTA
jgi:hypothetical protein